MPIQSKKLSDGFLYELKERSEFDKTTIRRLQLTQGVGIVLGKRIGAPNFEVFAIHFSNKQFTEQQAELFLRDNLGPSAEALARLATGETTPAVLLEMSEGEQKVIALAGFTALEQKNLKRARKLFEGLVALNPASNLGYTGMGKVQQAEKQYDAAMNSYKEALSWYANDVEALLGMAQIQLAKNQKKAALPSLMQILAIDPEGQEPASRTARQLVDSEYTTTDLKDFVEWGKVKVDQIAKEALRAQGKAVKTLSGAPTPAAAAAGILPQPTMRRA